MRQYKKYYLQILRIELEDLKEDIELLIEESKRKRKNEQITDHVYLANLTVFNNELLGVDKFFKIIDEVDHNRFKDLDEMINHILHRFKEKMDAYGIAKAVYICIERKMKKVSRYVMQGQLCYI